MMRKRPNRPIDKSLLDNIFEEGLDLDALDTPERIVAYCRDKGFYNGNATNIQELIEDNPKLNLEFQDIGKFDAFIEKTNADCFRIVINKRHSATRQRFSMAHEYIHYQFHRKEIEEMPRGERIMHRGDELNRIEYQANQNAAEVLMPDPDFRQVTHAKNGDISAVAKEFKVSLLAVRYRAKSLGISGHGL
jgi:Zn-dependent peptidase ImmA (M78 family)